jgi:hypothetical protein
VHALEKSDRVVVCAEQRVSEGNPIVAGITQSDDLPVTGGAFQKRRGGQADAFLMKLDKSGQKVLLGTYYEGSGLDHAGYDGGPGRDP